MKIGQEFKVSTPSQLKSLIMGTVYNIKEGDRALITQNGVMYLTGEARGKTSIDEDSKIQGYDIENISKRIANNLANNLDGFKEHLEDVDLDISYVVDLIFDELCNFI